MALNKPIAPLTIQISRQLTLNIMSKRYNNLVYILFKKKKIKFLHNNSIV